MSIDPHDVDGATILVGITRLAKDGSESMEQFSGVASVRPHENFYVVELHCDDGEFRTYPFDRHFISKASPGEYRLRSTGKIVIDPHYLMTFVIQESLDS